MKIINLRNENEYLIEIANNIIKIVEDSLNLSNKATIMLSGGNTPNKLYPFLLKKKDWENVNFLWSDERLVKLNSKKNNFSNSSNYFFKYIKYNKENFYPFDVSLFENKIKESSLQKINNFLRYNTIDLSILGMGIDGHTASIFNNIDLENKNIFYTKNKNENYYRVSMPINIINNSKSIFLLTNNEKLKVFNLKNDQPVNGIDENKLTIFNLDD